MGLKVGDKIKIITLTDEPYNTNYNGKVGTITKIETDPWGDERVSGTWGGVYVYTNIDEFEIMK
jgi:hypothetical protein